MEPVGGGVLRSQTFASLLVRAFVRRRAQCTILGCCLLATQINTEKKLIPAIWLCWECNPQCVAGIREN